MSDPKQALTQFGLLLRDYQKHAFDAGFYFHMDPRQAQRSTQALNATQEEIVKHFARAIGLVVP